MKIAKLSCWEKKSQSRELTPRSLSRRFTALNKKHPTSQAGFYVQPTREELDALILLAEPKAKAVEIVGKRSSPFKQRPAAAAAAAAAAAESEAAAGPGAATASSSSSGEPWVALARGLVAGADAAEACTGGV